MNVDVHYISISTQWYSVRVKLRVHIEIILISFEHIGSHFEFMLIV